MTELRTSGWLDRVQETFRRLRYAARDVQEKACQSIEQEHGGGEAAAKLRELFGGERTKMGKLVDRANKTIAGLEAKTSEIEQPEAIEQPKSTEEPTTPKMYRRRLVGNGQPKPKPEPEPPPPAEDEPKKAAVTRQKVAERRYGWSEVVIPKNVGDIEALTYVPGLVGQIVDWIVSGARRPNRVMALGVALGIVGTLLGRRVEGPTGNATHLYVFILAPTGWGKDWPLWCGNKLMIAVGAKALLGPSEFVSGRGIIKYLKRNPLVLCIVDELGELFLLVNNQHDNAFVRDVLGNFKKLYNSWGLINTAESVRDESVTINHPAVSIVGACTPQAFFEALTPIDIEGGFANRAMLLPFEGIRRPSERDTPEGADEPPSALIAELRLLRPEENVLDTPASEIKRPGEQVDIPPVDRKDRQIIRWGSGEAKAEYFGFSREIDQWEEKDRRKFELGMRAAENAVRCATIVASGCFSSTVDVGDIEWALKWSRVSFEAAEGGVKKYMRNYYEFPKFCDQVLEFMRSQEGGFASNRELGRTFRRNMKFGNELEKALAQLVREGHVKWTVRKPHRGPSAEGYEAIVEAPTLIPGAEGP